MNKDFPQVNDEDDLNTPSHSALKKNRSKSNYRLQQRILESKMLFQMEMELGESNETNQEEESVPYALNGPLNTIRSMHKHKAKHSNKADETELSTSSSFVYFE